jgi:hypothetical protein
MIYMVRTKLHGDTTLRVLESPKEHVAKGQRNESKGFYEDGRRGRCGHDDQSGS